MKTAIVLARPGRKIDLSKIDPDDTAGAAKEEALARVSELHEKLFELQQVFYADRGCSLLIVVQGMDTGGKDGSIKNLCHGLNPAGVRVAAFKTPTQTELDHDFLWRAHKATPAKGMIGIWNRSHYEDVLIVRVHKLVKKKVWKRRYEEINDFEQILTENGTTILKFMLHISRDEQKRRLEARLQDPKKQWKFNLSDLKERALWDDYQRAYEDAISRCSTKDAPWYIVPANHKWARNLAVTETVFDVLKKMKPRFPRLPFDPKTVTIE
ncbi:MAG TPA: polyphosphate kinase 2 family protein [Chthoniobacterales bacterium]